MTTPAKRDQQGFTLIEIIVALILVSIMGAMMFPVMRTNLTKSAIPVQRVDALQELIQHMDRITGLYREAIADDTLDIQTFKTTVVDTDPLVNAAQTAFVSSFNGGAYVPQSTTAILKVTLSNAEQSLTALFSE